jgi:hypothetical protein
MDPWVGLLISLGMWLILIEVILPNLDVPGAELPNQSSVVEMRLAASPVAGRPR